MEENFSFFLSGLHEGQQTNPDRSRTLERHQQIVLLIRIPAPVSVFTVQNHFFNFHSKPLWNRNHEELWRWGHGGAGLAAFLLPAFIWVGHSSFWTTAPPREQQMEERFGLVQSLLLFWGRHGGGGGGLQGSCHRAERKKRISTLKKKTLSKVEMKSFHRVQKDICLFPFLETMLKDSQRPPTGSCTPASEVLPGLVSEEFTPAPPCCGLKEHLPSADKAPGFSVSLPVSQNLRLPDQVIRGQ